MFSANSNPVEYVTQKDSDNMQKTCANSSQTKSQCGCHDISIESYFQLNTYQHVIAVRRQSVFHSGVIRSMLTTPKASPHSSKHLGNKNCVPCVKREEVEEKKEEQNEKIYGEGRKVLKNVFGKSWGQGLNMTKMQSIRVSKIY